MSTDRSLLWRTVAMSSVAVAFAVGTWYGSRMEAARQPWGRERLLSTALDSVRVNFLDSLPESELMRRAVSGMLRELHDPYAALLEREGMNFYRGTLRGESQGMGMVLRLRGTTALVRRVLPGSPAASGGLRAGDQILSVDGRSASDAWISPRAGTLKGDSSAVVSDTVRLQVVRAASSDTANLTLLRAPWHSSAVTEALMIANGVGYTRLANSVTGSADELERAVDSLVERGARSLVLDLRGNPGGLYDEGVKAASLFLSRGDVVASLDRRGSTEQLVQTARRSRWPNMPLVILVDAGTASSAELIAAALRDHGRAMLVGDHTYGKGVVQRVVPINSEISVRLTTARWLSPSRTSLERRADVAGRVTGGLTPDVRLTEKGRLDPSAVPPTLSPLTSRALSDAVDAAVMRAMLDDWGNAPVPLLERRLRALLAQSVAAIDPDPARQMSLLGDGTRVAMRRLLEMTRGDEALWQYAANDDVAIRTALDILVPHRLPAMARDTAVRDSVITFAAGDSIAVQQLVAYTSQRFRSALYDLDSTALSSVVRRGAAPRIDARLSRRASVQDTVVALHFATAPLRPAYPASATVNLADPSGVTTPLAAQVVARVAFRAPGTAWADSTRTSGWRYGWAYLVVLPKVTAQAHNAAFAGWQVVASPTPVAELGADPKRRTNKRSSARGSQR